MVIHYDDEVQAGDYGPLPRIYIDLDIDIPIGSPTGTYTASVHWDNATTTTFSFDVVQPYAPFVRLICENNERYKVLLLGFEPREKVRLRAYGRDYLLRNTDEDTLVPRGSWTATVGSDGNLLWLFPDNVEIDEIELIVAIGKSRPLTMTDTSGKTLLKVTAYETGDCLVDQP